MTTSGSLSMSSMTLAFDSAQARAAAKWSRGVGSSWRLALLAEKPCSWQMHRQRRGHLFDGLRVTDAIDTPLHLHELLSSHEPGQPVALRVLRHGELVALEVTPAHG
jgi:hypothetical protein